MCQSIEVNLAFSENCEARADEAGASTFPQVSRSNLCQPNVNFSSREDEMIWQDPVDYSHITYEYDHRCVKYYRVHDIGLGASHGELLQ